MKILLRHRTIMLLIGAPTRWLATLALLILLSAATVRSHAQTFASGTLGFSNPQVQLSSGTLQLLGPWNASAFAQAQNSLGENDGDFNSGLSPASLTADGVVTYAMTHGQASAPGDPPDFNLSGSASGQVDIPTFTTAQALGVARGAMYNSFKIIGGIGTIDVTFTVDIAGALLAMTGPTGVLAQIETIFALSLDGTPILFRSDFLSVGTNDSASSSFAVTLSATVPLTAGGDEHTLYFEVDSEPQGITSVPEASSLVLLLPALGVLALGWSARRRIDSSDKTTIGG